LDKCLRGFILISLTFIVTGILALCFGLCPFMYSNSFAHILFGVALFQLIFLLTYVVIGIAIPSFTHKSIDSLNILLLSLFFGAIIAYQIDVLNEIIGDETYSDQLYEICLDATGTTFALLVYLGVLFIKKTKCQWKLYWE